MIKAKKKFGQNFLKSDTVKDKIIQAIPDTKRIVEIGPGLGDLTQKLVNLNSHLQCFEIDSELYEILLDKFKDQIAAGKIDFFNCDALNAWDKISQSEYFLAANLPYYVATNIILHALEDENCLGAVLMIQKEVADKFCAHEGQKEFSALSVLANLHSKTELLFEVPPECFDPAPKVNSAVIRIIKTSEVSKNLDSFKKFLRAAFIAPRKTLFKNLSQIIAKEELTKIFSKLDLPSNIRPHELGVTSYKKLYKEVDNERRAKC